MFTAVRNSQINRLNRKYQRLIKEASVQLKVNPVKHNLIIVEAEYTASYIKLLSGE